MATSLDRKKFGPSSIEPSKLQKWRLFDWVSPSGIERTPLGTSVNVSANGTSTVAASELKKVALAHFKVMNDVSRDATASADEEIDKVRHG
jgi:hypothetical protein